MEGINKEHVIAGVIGGFSSLLLAFAIRKVIHRGHCQRMRKHGWGKQAEIVAMESARLPAAIGPFSKGKMIRQPNGALYAWTSGQLGMNPETGALAQGEDPIVSQAEQVLTNLKALAEDNGFDLQKHTVKNVVYLVDMADFAKVNEVYKRFFTSDFPARTCVAVAALPLGARVEIESVFFKPNEGCEGGKGGCPAMAASIGH